MEVGDIGAQIEAGDFGVVEGGQFWARLDLSLQPSKQLAAEGLGEDVATGGRARLCIGIDS